MTTATDVRDIRAIGRDDAADLARATYVQLTALLEQLDDDEWRRPTDCTGWDVAAMVGHMIGAAKENASMRESLRQQLHGMRTRKQFDGNALDAVNDLQVRDHADLTPQQRLRTLTECAPAAIRGRMRTPRLLHGLPLPMTAGGSTPETAPTDLTLGHLLHVIYTRDVWLHRIDIARATDRDPDVRHEADARIVADVVGEWARRHGQPFRLELTGPAGGMFQHGEGGQDLRLDAVEFCRVLSGRAPGDGLLRTGVLF